MESLIKEFGWLLNSSSWRHENFSRRLMRIGLKGRFGWNTFTQQNFFELQLFATRRCGDTIVSCFFQREWENNFTNNPDTHFCAWSPIIWGIFCVWTSWRNIFSPFLKRIIIIDLQGRLQRPLVAKLNQIFNWIFWGCKASTGSWPTYRNSSLNQEYHSKLSE